MTAPAIELAGLIKHYGPVRALDGIDLAVAPAQIFGFLGPNGAGKTTAIRVMLDLIRPTAGSARVLGLDAQRQSIEVRERSGYLPGDLRLYEHMLGDDFLDYMQSFRPHRRHPGYRRDLVARLNLDTSRRIRALSKGNRQKVGLVQALMHRPDVSILDEPTSGLDPLVQEEVARILHEVVEDGRTVFFSSHVLSEVERLAHAAAIIRAGRIVAVEEIGALRGRSAHIVDVTFAHDAPDAFAQISGVSELLRDGPRVRLRATDGIDPLVKTIARYPVVDLHTERPGLEDVFLSYYGDAEPAAEPAPAPDEEDSRASA
jgi:ABC-2 type transport system ATP-binding protein